MSTWKYMVEWLIQSLKNQWERERERERERAQIKIQTHKQKDNRWRKRDRQTERERERQRCQSLEFCCQGCLNFFDPIPSETF